VYVVGADDNRFDPNRDRDYNDLVVTCTCQDRTIIRPVKSAPIHFIVPRNQVVKSPDLQ